MHRLIAAPLAVLAAALLSLPLVAQAARAARAETRSCQVVGIADGDSFTALCDSGDRQQQVRVRFNGIDAPERRQPYGTRARQTLAQMIFRKDVDLDCLKDDAYGRSVCKVMVAPASSPAGPRTLDAGLAMVTLGMAWWYRAYAHEQTAQERGQYEFAETEARARRAGLWRDPDPVPPWQWRHAARSTAPQPDPPSRQPQNRPQPLN